MTAIRLWLDDMRPAPIGWLHATTVQEAKDFLLTGEVSHASLDHDLGACKDCLKGRTPDQWLAETNFTEMPHCRHVGTGYDLVCWMEEMKVWPLHKPTVHSANPAGRVKMQAAIDREWEIRRLEGNV